MMSKMPECKICGLYVHHGYCVCDDCSGKLDKKIAELEARVKQLENAIAAETLGEYDGESTSTHGS